MNFKNLFFAAIVLITFIFETSNAQQFNISVKGGYNLSGVSGYGNTQMSSGFNIYVSKEIISLPAVKISLETGYTQKGFADEFVFVDTNSSKEFTNGKNYYRLGYIDLSVLVKIGSQEGVLFPYILIGPSFGIKVSNTVLPSVLNPGVVYYEQFLEEFKNNSLGFKFGIGTEIDLSLVSVVAEARFSHDFTAAYSRSNFLKTIRINNHVFEFVIGAKF